MYQYLHSIFFSYFSHVSWAISILEHHSSIIILNQVLIIIFIIVLALAPNRGDPVLSADSAEPSPLPKYPNKPW